MKDSSVFLPLATEEFLFQLQRVLFCISCVLHIPALSCLLWQTPPHQTMIKPYLIACQICVIVCDVYFSVFFEPVAVGDMFGGYCRGFFCNLVGVGRSMALYIIIDGALLLATLSCIGERHQAMMPANNFFKLKKARSLSTKIVVFVLITFGCVIPTTAFAVYPFSDEESDRQINESSLDIGWVRERGTYLILPDSVFMHAIIWLAITIIFLYLIVLNIPFYHMFYVLNREKHTSQHTKSMIRLSLWRLYAQISVPTFLLGVPLNIFFVQAGTRCFPFNIAMTAKDPSIFIPLATEEILFLIQRVLFGFSCVLHIPALSCLLWQTPPHQTMIKPYLIACQIGVVFSDVYFSVFFEPVLIGDVFGGYCRGIFCRAVGTARAMALYIIIDAMLVLVILACILERHQAMMPSGNFFKLKRRTKIGIFVVVFLVCGTPTAIFTAYPFSVLESDRLINESIFDIAWIRERGAYVILPDNIFMHSIIWLAATVISIVLIVASAPFYHMFYVLNQEVHTSKSTKSLIQLSLRRLYAQISVPIFLLGIPLNIFFIQAGTRYFPFMFATVSLFIICLHPVMHNLILLLVIPTYRRAIVDAMSVWKWGSKLLRANDGRGTSTHVIYLQ